VADDTAALVSGAVHDVRSVMRRLKIRVLLAVLTLMSVGIAGSAQAASPMDKLKEAQERLEEVRDRLEKVSAVCERDERRVEDVNDRVKETLIAVTAAEIAVDKQERIVNQYPCRRALQAGSDGPDAVQLADVVLERAGAQQGAGAQRRQARRS
jgi:hypothetical protein